MNFQNFLFQQIIILFILSLIICKEESNKLEKVQFNSILSYLLEEEEESNIEEEKEKEKLEENKDDDIEKLKKTLNDKPEEQKLFDLLFLVDATGSMFPYIQAVKEETENISKELRKLYPEYNFQYGYIFYRDPIDSPSDIHEIINLTDQVNILPEQISKIRATGGGDLPEDWAGAYKLANEKINWRNGLKVIIHLADAGAHGKEFTLSDKYPLESDKLKNELLKCSKNNIKIFGFVITEDARNSFNKCQSYYIAKGGSYEIYDLKINEKIHKPHYYGHEYDSFDLKPKKSHKKMDIIEDTFIPTDSIHTSDSKFFGIKSLGIFDEIKTYGPMKIGGAPLTEPSLSFGYNIKTRDGCYREKESSLDETQEKINSIFREKVLSSIKKVLN